MKTCVFAGTFDPITNGHKFVIDKCLEIFDKVIIAIGVNQEKRPMFSLDGRKEMLLETFKDDPRVEVDEFNGMLVDFMKQKGVKVNVRGIRDAEDYKYETTMERYNRDMYPEMTTVYIPTPKEMVHVSSTAIRNVLYLNGDISPYVPTAVVNYVKKLDSGEKTEQ